MQARIEWTMCMFLKQSHNGQFYYENTRVLANVPHAELEPATRAIARRKNQYFPHTLMAMLNSLIKMMSRCFTMELSADHIGMTKMIDWSIWFFLTTITRNTYQSNRLNRHTLTIHTPKLSKSINDFCTYYFNDQRTSCVSLCPKIGNEISVWLNGKYETEIVVEYSRGQELIAIQFKNVVRIEWIYRGSERIKEVKQSMNKFFEQRPSTIPSPYIPEMSSSIRTVETMEVDPQSKSGSAKGVVTIR